MKYIQNTLVVLLILSFFNFIETSFHQDSVNQEINTKLDRLLEKAVIIENSNLENFSLNQKTLIKLKKYNKKISKIHSQLEKKNIKSIQKIFLEKDLNESKLYRKNILNSFSFVNKEINLSIPNVNDKNFFFIQAGLDFINSELMTRRFSLKVKKFFIYKEKSHYILELKLFADIENIYTLINQLRISNSYYYFNFTHLFIGNEFNISNGVNRKKKDLLNNQSSVNYLNSSLYIKAIIILKNEVL